MLNACVVLLRHVVPCLQEIDACRRQRLDAFAEIVRLRECVESVGREMRKREEAIHTTIDARDAAKHTAQTVRGVVGGVGFVASR